MRLHAHPVAERAISPSKSVPLVDGILPSPHSLKFFQNFFGGFSDPIPWIKSSRYYFNHNKNRHVIFVCMKICLICGKEFEPKNPKGRFCSAKCRQKDYRNGVKKQLEVYRASQRKNGKYPTLVPEAMVLISPEAEMKAVQKGESKNLGPAEKNRTASPLQQEIRRAPRAFHELLQAAKEPGVDRGALEAEIKESKNLTPNQRDMLSAKLKNL